MSIEVSQRSRSKYLVVLGFLLTRNTDSTGIWNDEWDVTRGQQGKAAGQGPFSGSLLIDPTTASKFCITFRGSEVDILTIEQPYLMRYHIPW
jgi:hypothetical protein